ncbi:MAG: A/G-specific adenine glycosylase [Deltaproteobacteria bacterium]|nr:A/G-specific adenine glycosylase [Deltaproteobacteria bacterium]
MRPVLRWFDSHRRELPWRQGADPYRVWVSEIMLQQTRVATVIPYYERFVRRYPDLASLAAARLDDLLKVWEGLGYYRRVRGLKRAADELVAEGRNQLPDDYDRILALPGVGRSTAGAIMSLGFNRPYPIQDGNVRRVLCRLGAIAEAPNSPAVQGWLWDTAAALLPRGGARRLNEALMDFGASVCTPRTPGCDSCPVAPACGARHAGDVLAYPQRVRRAALPHYDVTAAIIQRGKRLLITKRRAEAMLGGLWEFPGGKLEPGETLEECLLREIAEELDIVVRIERPFVQVQHAYSHFRITLHTFLCRHSRGRPRTIGCDAWKWVRPAELSDYAFPKADRVVIEALQRELD